jgi:hypothetical protein
MWRTIRGSPGVIHDNQTIANFARLLKQIMPYQVNCRYEYRDDSGYSDRKLLFLRPVAISPLLGGACLRNCSRLLEPILGITLALVQFRRPQLSIRPQCTHTGEDSNRCCSAARLQLRGELN